MRTQAALSGILDVFTWKERGSVLTSNYVRVSCARLVANYTYVRTYVENYARVNECLT